MGPVDYLVVGFPGNKFSGKIAPELAALEKSGIIRIIDFVFVLKDANGKLDIKELKDLKVFNSVKPVLGSIQWQGGQDFCPDTLYLESIAQP